MDRFAQVSGYRINQAKSTIFGINVKPNIKEAIQKFDLTPWSKKVRYLEIYITLPQTDLGLKQQNLYPLLHQFGRQFKKW